MVGLVHYEGGLAPRNGAASATPFTPVHISGALCPECGHLETSYVENAACLVCAHSKMDERNLVTPLGFRVDYGAEPEPYRLTIERPSRARTPRVTSLPTSPPTSWHNVDLRFGEGDIYIVNDNGGIGFCSCDSEAPKRNTCEMGFGHPHIDQNQRFQVSTPSRHEHTRSS